MLLLSTIYPILLLLLIPAFSLRFYISTQSDGQYVFNEGVDATISVITGLISIALLLCLLSVIVLNTPTMVFVLSAMSMISINIVITRYYMPKIIHLFAGDEADGIFYFIGLIFMFFSAFLLPVVFIFSNIMKQATTQNYFYKLYTEEKNKEGNKK